MHQLVSLVPKLQEAVGDLKDGIVFVEHVLGMLDDSKGTCDELCLEHRCGRDKILRSPVTFRPVDEGTESVPSSSEDPDERDEGLVHFSRSQLQSAPNSQEDVESSESDIPVRYGSRRRGKCN